MNFRAKQNGGGGGYELLQLLLSKNCAPPMELAVLVGTVRHLRVGNSNCGDSVTNSFWKELNYLSKGFMCLKSVGLAHTECRTCHTKYVSKVSKAVPLHAMEALGGRGGIARTHSRPRH
jgi:hypothetical protein